MRNAKSLVLGVAALLTIGGGAVGGAWVLRQHQPAQAAATKPLTTQRTEQQSTYLTYQGEEGKTALTILKAKATVETKNSSYGPYVESINGLKSGTDGKYWSFYVNGAMATVGADAYVTKGGDNVEWKFQ